MSLNIKWEKLDQQLARSLQLSLNRKFRALTKPSFLGEVEIVELDFGSVPPQVTILDLTDPFDEFYGIVPPAPSAPLSSGVASVMGGAAGGGSSINASAPPSLGSGATSVSGRNQPFDVTQSAADDDSSFLRRRNPSSFPRDGFDQRQQQPLPFMGSRQETEGNTVGGGGGGGGFGVDRTGFFSSQQHSFFPPQEPPNSASQYPLQYPEHYPQPQPQLPSAQDFLRNRMRSSFSSSATSLFSGASTPGGPHSGAPSIDHSGYSSPTRSQSASGSHHRPAASSFPSPVRQYQISRSSPFAIKTAPVTPRHASHPHANPHSIQNQQSHGGGGGISTALPSFASHPNPAATSDPARLGLQTVGSLPTGARIGMGMYASTEYGAGISKTAAAAAAATAATSSEKRNGVSPRAQQGQMQESSNSRDQMEHQQPQHQQQQQQHHHHHQQSESSQRERERQRRAQDDAWRRHPSDSLSFDSAEYERDHDASFIPRSPRDVQLLLQLSYRGDTRMTVSTELKINYPTLAFMSMPMVLSLTGFTFQGTLVIAYLSNRINFGFLPPDDEANPFSSPLIEVSIESEVGDKSKQVLKNVGKIERFVVDQLRKLLAEELVWPNYHSVVFEGPNLDHIDSS